MGSYGGLGKGRGRGYFRSIRDDITIRRYEVDNEQELLSREEVVSKIPPDDGFTYYRAFGELIAQAQVAKLKAMGYVSPEECKAGEEETYEKGKREGYSLGRADTEGDCVKWDRKKVAFELYKEDYGTNFAGWLLESKAVKDFWYKRADQLKEILTGGKDGY